MFDDSKGYFHTAFPQQIVVEATAGCNQSCIFCGRTYMDRPKKTMTTETFQKIADEVALESPYTELWPAFMGESMLLGDKIFSWIRYAHDAGCKKITLNTNGTRLNETTVPAILASGLNRLIVSCDAHTPETHRIVRPPINPKAPDGLEQMYRGIHLLLDAMEQDNSGGMVLELQYSIFDENEHEVEAFKEYWLAQGAIVKVRPKLYWSGSVEGGDHRVTYKGRVPCLWSLETMGVHWNGNVVMCVVDCEGKYVAGNVEMQSLKQIWDGPLKWIRELHMRERFSELPEICRTCPDWRVKKAHTYYPEDEAKKQAYEKYVTTGRIFMERHYWDEKDEEIR
jgi:radical SAM protein with 4Fe4S-binding SPASM domain